MGVRLLGLSDGCVRWVEVGRPCSGLSDLVGRDSVRHDTLRCQFRCPRQGGFSARGMCVVWPAGAFRSEGTSPALRRQVRHLFVSRTRKRMKKLPGPLSAKNGLPQRGQRNMNIVKYAATIAIPSRPGKRNTPNHLQPTRSSSQLPGPYTSTPARSPLWDSDEDDQ